MTVIFITLFLNSIYYHGIKRKTAQKNWKEKNTKDVSVLLNQTARIYSVLFWNNTDRGRLSFEILTTNESRKIYQLISASTNSI